MQTLHGTPLRGTAASKRAAGIKVAAIAAIAALAAASTGVAAQIAAPRFKQLPRSGPIAAHRLPLSLSREAVKVTLILDGESVAEARARAPQHAISDADHQAIHARLARQHAGIEASVAARGGRVLAQFRDAMNGVKVEVPRSEIAGLASLPGVLKVVPVAKHKRSNTVSVPFIGAPQVWQGTPGLHGERVKIAIIDTGIDYTHANFGGPGTVAAFQSAAMHSTEKPDPSLVGPKAPKVKGGTDLVGDDYDADTAGSVPKPDPNPLDCDGHGSHVAGTAAGFGVGTDGKTYHGPYTKAAYDAGFTIGPGVAPLADIYSVRVFGCAGSSDVIDEAIEWAVDHNVDVISMSLGADYGTADSSDSVAANNAAKAGIVVVAAAGNAGPNPYLVSSPASGGDVIAVAAIDARPFLVDGVRITLASGTKVDGVNENELPLPGGKVPVLILKSGTSLSLGCDAADYPKGGAKGALVIIARGTCTFDQKAQNAMAAGAAVLAVVNNDVGFFSPVLDDVTIPFIAVQQTDAATLAAQASPTTGMVAAANIANSGYRLAATFSSGGPRSEDGALKPDVSAPGVNVFSTSVGTGNQGFYDSGTSMATPHVSGVAALVVQAHANWREPDVRAAVEQTALPAVATDYAPRIEGAGVVQALGATKTDVTVRGTAHRDLGLLSFGVVEMTADYHDSREITLTNHGRFTSSFAASTSAAGGVAHDVRLSSSSVAVHGGGESSLRVTLSVAGAAVGAAHDADGNDRMAEVAGYLRLMPEASSNHGVSLTVPYYLVPRARSNVDADLNAGKNPTIRLTNRNGLIAGIGDFYAWGLRNKKSGAVDAAFEPRAIGAQSIPISDTDNVLVFAVNTWGRFSNPAAGEYDIYIDTSGDGKPDFVLFSADYGAVVDGTANGECGVFLQNLVSGDLLPEFDCDAPTDGSTVLMPVFGSDLGLTPDNPRLSYFVNAFDAAGGSEEVPGTAYLNAFTPAVSNSMFVPVAPNKSVLVPVSVDRSELRKTPALGFMVVTSDNMSGGGQANLLPLR